MNGEILYLIATILIWSGAYFLLRAVVRGFRAYLAGRTEERTAALRATGISLAVGGFLLVLGMSLPRDVGRVVEGSGIPIPIVWPNLPIGGWIGLFGFIGGVIALLQAWQAISIDDRKEKLTGSLIWFGVLLAGAIWWFNEKQPFTVLRGVFFAQPAALLGLLALAIGAMFIMALSEKALRARGLARKIVVQLTLLAGVIVFGLPFAWLIATSFKEERDMAMTEGLKWIPEVQVTHAFMDESHPLVEAWFDGRKVQAQILGLKVGGKMDLEVERPYGLRGRQFEAEESATTRIPRYAPVVDATYEGKTVRGFVAEELNDGTRRVEIMTPETVKGQRFIATGADAKPVRHQGARWENYTEAIEWLPLETNYGLAYLKNTMILVIMSVIGTLLSCSLVAYGFSRLRFPGREFLFNAMLATMMLPAAVTMLPTFLIFRTLGWFDTLLPIWVPTFFAGAFNVFLLRQFFRTIPMELEDAAKIDGCGYLRTYWQVMMPQIKPALAAIAIWTFMGAWNNFMGPLIYVSSPENMPVAYAIQLFQSDRGSSFGLMMAFATMATLPVVALFFFAQRWFIEGVQLSGLGGR
jgi:multiple sugar transport system permease protein